MDLKDKIFLIVMYIYLILIFISGFGEKPPTNNQDDVEDKQNEEWEKWKEKCRKQNKR